VSEARFSPRRWPVLLALMAVTLACEAQWLAHAAVARPAAAYYAGQFDPKSWLGIDFLAMSYMLVFLVACLPASWILDRWGLGIGVGIGAALTIAGSIGKAVFASSFTAQIAFQLVLALAQPFLTNAATTLARDWFPPKERATAVGLASLAQYLGFVVALVVAPALVQIDPALPGYGGGIELTLAVFGIVGALSGLAALALIRRGPGRELGSVEGGFFQSLRKLWASRDFRWTLLLFFLGLGIMNTVTALTDQIAASMGVQDSNGLLGVALIVGGIVGAVVLPILSDRMGRRKAFLVLCIGLTVPALGALALAPAGAYGLAIGAMALLGFALMSAGPIGFQYAAELTAPAPESASQGALLLAGQVSGLALTAGMSAGGASAARYWIWAFAVAALFMTLLTLRLGESPAVARK
jgi:MFS family permease